MRKKRDYDHTTADGQKRMMAESMGLDTETYISKPIPTNWEPPECKPEDIELLEKHGMAGLKEMGFHGVIDRLSRRKI